MKKAAFLTNYHVSLDIQVQCKGVGTGSPTYTCWEEPGPVFLPSVCLQKLHPLNTNCHRNPKGKESLWMSGSCIYLIHLKAKLLRSNESEADDLSLRGAKSYSPYLVFFPSAACKCMNVSSNRLCCKRSYLRSTAYLLPALPKLSHNSFKCMLMLSSKNVICDISIWKKRCLIFFLLTHLIVSSKILLVFM